MGHNVSKMKVIHFYLQQKINSTLTIMLLCWISARMQAKFHNCECDIA